MVEIWAAASRCALDTARKDLDAPGAGQAKHAALQSMCSVSEIVAQDRRPISRSYVAVARERGIEGGENVALERQAGELTSRRPETTCSASKVRLQRRTHVAFCVFSRRNRHPWRKPLQARESANKVG